MCFPMKPAWPPCWRMRRHTWFWAIASSTQSATFDRMLFDEKDTFHTLWLCRTAAEEQAADEKGAELLKSFQPS